MSYCRKRSNDFGDCDQYVIAHVAGPKRLTCIDCTLLGDGSLGSEWFWCDTGAEMVAHLEQHRAKGEIVSEEAIAKLIEDDKLLDP
jgi:hypothetical protein